MTTNADRIWETVAVRAVCRFLPAQVVPADLSSEGPVFAASCEISPLRHEEPDVAGRGGLLGSVPGLAGRAKFRDE